MWRLRWFLLLVVLVGVLGMHGLSGVHAHSAQVPADATASHGTAVAVDATSAMSSASTDGDHPGTASAGTPSASGHSGSGHPDALAPSDSMGEQLLAMCLAILLGVVLIGVLRLRRIHIGRAAERRRVPGSAAMASVLRPRPPTLHQLCVLRI